MKTSLSIIYTKFESLNPDKRQEHFIALLDRNKDLKIEFPMENGKALDLSGGIDLSSTALIGKFGVSYLSKKKWWVKTLQGLNLEKSDLRGANLWGARLCGVNLLSSNLVGINLQGADLRGGWFNYSNLSKANLRYAYLQNVELYDCELSQAYLFEAHLDKTRFNFLQLGECIGEEADARKKGVNYIKKAENYFRAWRTYSLLRNNFDSLGDYESSVWAYKKGRRMEKKTKLWNFVIGIKQRKLFESTKYLVQYMIDQLVEWICDYGESATRVFLTIISVFLGCTLFYGLIGGVLEIREVSGQVTKVVTKDLVDLLRFSLGAMTTLQPTGLEPSGIWVEILASIEMLITVMLTGLLGFVLGNRIRR